jgi:hypothetical protein
MLSWDADQRITSVGREVTPFIIAFLNVPRVAQQYSESMKVQLSMRYLCTQASGTSALRVAFISLRASLSVPKR